MLKFRNVLLMLLAFALAVSIPNKRIKLDVDNKELLHELSKHGKDWHKVFHAGYLHGKKYSMHYFTDNAGNIFT